LVDALELSGSLRLAVYEDDRGRTFPVPLAESPTARRAVAGDGASSALVALLAGGDRIFGRFEVTTWHHEPATGERAISVDQTNESVVVGEQAVVKWTFVADGGPHPAPSLLAELERSGFTGMPRPWGAVQWRPSPEAPPRLLALVVSFVEGATDGWTWVVDALQAAASSDDDRLAGSAGSAVGTLVASFHRALALTSRPAAVEEASALTSSALADLDLALSVSSGPSRAVLSGHAAAVRSVLEGMPDDATPLMRVHGDLHIGQVLRSGTTYCLTDFDGNPVVPASSRGLVQPSASDVASMAQSFTHAGLVVRKHHPSLDLAVVDRMARAARSSFLATYRSALGDQTSLYDERLLRPFALRQVCREFTYAATHLPRWSYVPEAALPMLLEKDEL
jgi:maltokinase